MSLERAPSTIAGVRFGATRRFADDRGWLIELWRASTSEGVDAIAAGTSDAGRERFVQANMSSSSAGVLRGLHLHRRQLDHWTIVGGRALVALVDVRPMLEGTAPVPIVETRELDADDWVDIPAGVAHGFLALEPIQLIYHVTNEFDGSDELGFAWDDPVAAVPWPTVATPDGRPILSDRDRSNPSLEELVVRLRDGSS